MTGMIFARSGLGYVAGWDQGGVEVRIDHLRRRSGELGGELSVAAAAVPWDRGQLHRAAFNVSSTTARDRLAKTLAERSRGATTEKGVGLPWDMMLEQFCSAVLSAEQEGSPIVRIGNLPPRPAEGYLVDPILVDGRTTILYAAGGTGKSYLAVLLAVAVASGKHILGWGVQRTKVLYLDWETDSFDLDDRVKRVATGLGIAAPEILYRSCASPLEDMAEQVSGIVSTEGIGLVIVDSVGMASGSRHDGPAEDSAIRLFGAFRHLNTTVLAIDHVTGEDVKSDKAVYKPYGSIYKVNLARSVWELKGTPNDFGTESHLALYHRKVNRGRLLSPIGLVVKHTETAVEFATEEINDAGLVTGMSNTVRVERVLRGGAASVRDLSDETGLSEAVVRVTLNRGANQLFAKLSDGRWGLVTR